MELITLNELWKNAIYDLLKVAFDDDVLNTLCYQTQDSIRRINIYKKYAEKAEKAEMSNMPFIHTSNPFTLSQRNSIDISSKVWYIYLATYFGKSTKSKWTLFNNSAFKKDGALILLSEIEANRKQYYDYLKSIDFFECADYSNHRKFTKKSLDGEKGVFHSMDYFLDNIGDYSHSEPTDFDVVFKNALKIPNFGRLAAFDFTSSLCKCNLNIKDPVSMYHENSSGPLRALEDFLVLANCRDRSKSAQIKLGNDLLHWFIKNSDIEVVAQVLEDAICNWQKSPKQYKRYFG